MRRAPLSVQALPAWALLNDIGFFNTSVQSLPGRGYGLAANRALTSSNNYDQPAILSIPEDLVLSATFIEEYAKVDKHFRQLREAMGFSMPSQEIMLFLFYQMTITSPDNVEKIGVSTSWTEYARMLPSLVPVPTTWSDQQREMLVGTSLEASIESKMSALTRQYDEMIEKAELLDWTQAAWFGQHSFTVADWVHVDSLYRSRCLEIPAIGLSMVPCMDMANHSNKANAYYDRSAKGDKILLSMRADQTVGPGEEITISYGEEKSAAEMLFSYGFIDNDTTSTKSLVLDLQCDSDDPFGKAKQHVFPGAPSVKISQDEHGNVGWESAFVHLMCLNEEDGLDFKVSMRTDGQRGELGTFYNEVDISDSTNQLERLTSTETFKDIYRLRSVAMILNRIEVQLEALSTSEDVIRSLAIEPKNLEYGEYALRLRDMERDLLLCAQKQLEVEKTNMFDLPIVRRYMQWDEIPESDDVEPARTSEEDVKMEKPVEDFS